jgi:hypothetical protein
VAGNIEPAHRSPDRATEVNEGVGVFPTSFDFGTHPVGSATAQAIILSNCTANAVPIRRVLTSPPQEFQESNNCGTSLPPGSTCMIDISFTPKAATHSRGFLFVIWVKPDPAWADAEQGPSGAKSKRRSGCTDRS